MARKTTCVHMVNILYFKVVGLVPGLHDSQFETPPTITVFATLK
jgi:hypothetical protein